MATNAGPGRTDARPPRAAAGLRQLVLDAMGSRLPQERNRVPSGRRDRLAGPIERAETDVGRHVRAHLADRLAQSGEVPPSLLHQLLTDDIEVARPLLGQGADLPEALLADVAERGSEAHRRVIAARPGLPARAAQLIASRGDGESLVVLAEKAAALDEETLSVLARRAGAHPDLGGALCRRGDATMAICARLFWVLGGEERCHVIGRLAGEPPAETVGLLDADMALGRLVAAARQGRRSKLAEIAAEAAAFPPALAGRIVHDPGGEPLAVFLRALSAPRAEMSTLLVLASGDAPHTAARCRSLVELAVSLSEEGARAVLGHWLEATGGS